MSLPRRIRIEEEMLFIEKRGTMVTCRRNYGAPGRRRPGRRRSKNSIGYNAKHMKNPAPGGGERDDQWVQTRKSPRLKVGLKDIDKAVLDC